MNLHGTKVVSAKEMARVESLSYKDGAKEEDYVDTAGKSIFLEIERFIEENALEKSLYLLIGKGNNGADTYTSGLHFLKEHYEVVAFHPFDFDECSPLCAKKGKEFIERGGRVVFLENLADMIFQDKGIIVDGLLGTGFKGKLEGTLLHMVEKANNSHLPIVSVDIPSGVNGTSGAVESSAIKATLTIYLGLLKSGFFLKQGYDHVGNLRCADFGLPASYIEKANPFAHVIDEDKLFLPEIIRTRHKYSVGQVTGIGGSREMSGAAGLASLAALRSGAGIMKLFYPPEATEAMHSFPMEIIRRSWDGKYLQDELTRTKALFVGPGLGREKDTFAFLKEFLPTVKAPLVIDADGLFFLAKEKVSFAAKEVIVTPHHKEMQRLLNEDINQMSELIPACQNYAEEKKIKVILKGAPTWFFYPDMPPLIVPRGDPGLATGGTGDILTGVVTALLAQGMDSYSASIMAIYLHALAGEIAAEEKTSYCMIASDLLDTLPYAFMIVASNASHTMR